MSQRCMSLAGRGLKNGSEWNSRALRGGKEVLYEQMEQV